MFDAINGVNGAISGAVNEGLNGLVGGALGAVGGGLVNGASQQGFGGMAGGALGAINGGIIGGISTGGSSMAGGGIKIQIVYEDMGNISQMLSRMGDDIAQTIQKINSDVQQLQGGGWKGHGAEAFYEEMQTVTRELQELQQAYEKQQSKINDTVKHYQDIEQQILGLFSSL